MLEVHLRLANDRQVSALDGIAEAGRRDVQDLGGFREAAWFHYGDERREPGWRAGDETN